MKHSVSIVFILLLLSLTACSTDKLSGNRPPDVLIEANGKTYETVLGSYCWSEGFHSTCVDTAGPIELLKDREPIKVKPGESITILMDYKPKPKEYELYQVKENNKDTEISLQDHQFTGPSSKGVYFYSYGVWWLDEEDSNMSNGDAFYAFSIEVE
ncbi:hypothetical protein [Cytobacillus purgationiresistens]|uniref:Lipoprotein n=1 Tax=Cytobacillus purgationiresistens TaxID=863449 RepID=A0ABU0AGK3_9BACI|nr:hypothetical protein [Cytobacillus purgationiresistens]MDQ0270374.1 hypothetical protein [Cytobacillus purgationiresistens]